MLQDQRLHVVAGGQALPYRWRWAAVSRFNYFRTSLASTGAICRVLTHTCMYVSQPMQYCDTDQAGAFYCGCVHVGRAASAG